MTRPTRRELVLSALGLAGLGLATRPSLSLPSPDADLPAARAAAERLLAHLDRGGLPARTQLSVQVDAGTFRLSVADEEGVLVLAGADGRIRRVSYLDARRERRRFDTLATLAEGRLQRASSSLLASRRIAPRPAAAGALSPIYATLARRLLAFPPR
ncbi:MAG: hypothetical protein R3325_09440 [Thermoanaerobaculia bacterium]|nr:hypothetical protein [Thermoanaerobaculia bacterium]